MPDAHTTPSRSPSTSSRSRPASDHASLPAMTANCPERSSRRAWTRGSISSGSTATRAAMRTGSSAAQSSVRARTPERPATKDSQVVATSPPTGVVAPSPVMTTRVWVAVIGSGTLPLDEGHGVADGCEVLHLVVRDLHAELLLGGDDHLDHRQRVDVEVVDEGLVHLDVLGGNAGDLVNDVGQAGTDLLGGGHVGFSFSLTVLLGPPRRTRKAR